MPKKIKALTISLKGRPEDRGDVRLGDFLEFFGDVLRCLRGVDRSVSHREKLSADYRITGLRRGSATVVVEPIAYPKVEDRTREIVETFTEGLVSMQEKGKAPPHFDRPLMESFKTLARPLSKLMLGRREVAVVNIDPSAAELAGKLRESCSKKGQSLSTPDAQHLAVAILHGVDEVHTFDDRLIKKSGNLAGHDIKICKPESIQPRLPYPTD